MINMAKNYSIDFQCTGLNITWLLPATVTAPQLDPATGFWDATQYQLNPFGTPYSFAADELVQVERAGTSSSGLYPWTGPDGLLLVSTGEISVKGLMKEDKVFDIENIIMQTPNMIPSVGNLGIVNMGSRANIDRVVLITTDPLIPTGDHSELGGYLDTRYTGLLAYAGIGFGVPRIGSRAYLGGVGGTQYNKRFIPEMDNVILGRHDVWAIDKTQQLPFSEIGSYDLRYPDPATLIEGGYHDTVYRQLKLESSTTWGECREVFQDRIYITQIFVLGCLDRKELAAPVPTAPSDNPLPANMFYAVGGGQLEMPAIHIDLQGSVRKLQDDEALMLLSKQIVDYDIQRSYSTDD